MILLTDDQYVLFTREEEKISLRCDIVGRCPLGARGHYPGASLERVVKFTLSTVPGSFGGCIL